MLVKKTIFGVLLFLIVTLVFGREVAGALEPGCFNCVASKSWEECLSICYPPCPNASGVTVPDSFCGSRNNVCCTSGGCSSPCGTLPQWGWCYASECRAYPVRNVLGMCRYEFDYSYSNCGAVDSCQGGSFLKSGLCSSGGCTVGGNYKACCVGSNLVNCAGGTFSGTCPGGSVTKFCGFDGHPPCDASACAGPSVPADPLATPTPLPPTGGNCSGCPWWQQDYNDCGWCTNSSQCNGSGLCNKRTISVPSCGECEASGWTLHNCNICCSTPGDVRCCGCGGSVPDDPPCTPNCACSSTTCIGQTCSDGCGGRCNGTMDCNICGYVRAGLSNRSVSGYSINIYNDRTRTTSTLTTDSEGKFRLSGVQRGDAYAVRPSTSAFPQGLTGPPQNIYDQTSFEMQSFGGLPDCSSACNCNFKLNVRPVYTNLIVRNSANTAIVNPDAQGRNHICQVDFVNRRARFIVTVTDEDGGDTIEKVFLRFVKDGVGKTYYVEAIGDVEGMVNVKFHDSESGQTINYGVAAYTHYSGTSRTVEFQIDFPATFTTKLYDLRVYAEDENGIGTYTDGDNDGYDKTWIFTNRKFKIWDCKVLVTGTLYDGSAVEQIHCPTGTGYSTAYPNDEADFTGFDFVLYGGGSLKMTANSESDYHPEGYPSDKNNYLVWGKSYYPEFNDQLQANDPAQNSMRVNQVTCVDTLLVDADAYASNPAMRVDFTTIKWQPPWFQSIGGGVLGQGVVWNKAPVTCRDLCVPVLSLGETSMPGNFIDNNGIVTGGDLQSYIPLSNNFSWPRNFYKASNVVDPSYGYDYFLNKLHVEKEYGTVWLGDSVNLSSLTSNADGIHFVSGDLVLDANKIVNTDNFFLVVVGGDIIANNPAVNRVDGIYAADGNFDISQEASEKLLINGSIYVRGSFMSNRSYTDKSINNTNPAVVVHYRPAFLFKAPTELFKILTRYYDD